MKENSTNKSVENARGQINKQMKMKQNNLGIKYGNKNNITENPVGLTIGKKNYKKRP